MLIRGFHTDITRWLEKINMYHPPFFFLNLYKVRHEKRRIYPPEQKKHPKKFQNSLTFFLCHKPKKTHTNQPSKSHIPPATLLPYRISSSNGPPPPTRLQRHGHGREGSRWSHASPLPMQHRRTWWKPCGCKVRRLQGDVELQLFGGCRGNFLPIYSGEPLKGWFRENTLRTDGWIFFWISCFFVRGWLAIYL